MTPLSQDPLNTLLEQAVAQRDTAMVALRRQEEWARLIEVLLSSMGASRATDVIDRPEGLSYSD